MRKLTLVTLGTSRVNLDNKIPYNKLMIKIRL